MKILITIPILVFAICSTSVCAQSGKSKIAKKPPPQQQILPQIVDFGNNKPSPSPFENNSEFGGKGPKGPPLGDDKGQNDGSGDNWRPPPIPPLKDDLSKVQNDGGNSDGWRPPPIPPLKN